MVAPRAWLIMAFMVHEDHEKNALDQRHLSAELREAGVEVVCWARYKKHT